MRRDVMCVERRYLAWVTQTYEVPNDALELDEYGEIVDHAEADETICARCPMVSEHVDALDDWQLSLRILES